ncbi:septal ring lytic transglycosylase RlpA family protein [Flavobacterium sp. XGLA_31]|uniref:septal ring lytic transglycosylase RlpA family protein n=1 Tax=Flavobacterium sp. XGLA_31 TaxID=3447666 RepID=UPI003F323C98
MNKKIIIFLFAIITIGFEGNVWANHPQQKEKNKAKSKEKTTSKEKDSKEKEKTAVLKEKDSKDKTKTTALTKTDSLKNKPLTELEGVIDTLKSDQNVKFKFYKKNAHASYYAAKFHGKKTASGVRFDNNKYTAAHKKLPFGTKVRVTNEANGKSVIVEITDRGPFSKVREIDLSKKAFMELVDNKNTGAVMVKLEVEDK